MKALIPFEEMTDQEITAYELGRLEQSLNTTWKIAAAVDVATFEELTFSQRQRFKAILKDLDTAMAKLEDLIADQAKEG